MARFSVLFLLIAPLMLVACQADQPDAGSAEPESLPEISEDYEENPYPWGFIDSTGRMVISGQYDEVRAFSDGLALVRTKGRWGYIDQGGKVAIAARYRAAWPFANGRARAQTDAGKFGYIDRAGNWLIDAKFAELSEFSEGLAAFRQEEFYGYLDTTGQVVINAEYSKASPFQNGQSVVAKGDKYGIIDLQGKELIPFEHERLKPFAGTLARARAQGVYGYLNTAGEFTIEPAYRQATDFVSGVAAVAEESTWGLINEAGEWVLEPLYDQLFPAGEERWIAALGRQYYLLDKAGTRISNRPYQEIQPFCEGYAAYQQDELWGYLRPDGSSMAVPQYYLAWPFKNGLARVATRYGLTFINTSGRPLFQARRAFFELRDFSEGLAPAEIQ
ncbi:MAG: WG repeat-containing protein [Bacteroidota bacterium]